MCVTCGCGDDAGATITNLQTGATQKPENAPHSHGPGHPPHSHSHDHGHLHHHDHAHDDQHRHDHTHTHDDDGHHHPHHQGHDHAHRADGAALAARHAVSLDVERAILAKNDALAERNRAWFDGREILALNLVSSPGAGKTSLLERTIRDLGGELPIYVIEGDQQTVNDAQRIKAAGAPAVQVNTGTGCHLEADMVRRGLDALRPAFGAVVMIENVGNLVCPALFDLGERAKVVILSVAEGEDKPVKYPHMFRAAELMIVSKIDLCPHVDFDVDRCEAMAREVNPDIRSIRLSTRSGEGLADWYDWLRAARLAARNGDSIAL